MVPHLPNWTEFLQMCHPMHIYFHLLDVKNRSTKREKSLVLYTWFLDEGRDREVDLALFDVLKLGPCGLVKDRDLDNPF